MVMLTVRTLGNFVDAFSVESISSKLRLVLFETKFDDTIVGQVRAGRAAAASDLLFK